jgi:hypothetical protein
MNQILKKRVAIIALFALFISLTNCVNESIDSSNQNNSVANAKKWFELNKPSLSVLNYTKSIDWNNAIASTGDMGTIIEVPLLLKDDVLAKIGDDNSYKTYNRLMFIADTQGTYKTYHVLITTDNTSFESTSKSNNFYSLEDNFDGYVTVLGSKDKIVNLKKIVNGVETKPSLAAKAPLTCIYFGEISYPVGSDVPDFRALYLVGCYSQPTDYPLDYGVSHGGGGGGAGNKAQAIEDQIKDSKLDSCPKGVLNKLKNTANCDIANVLTKLGTNTLYNVNIESGNSVKPANTIRNSRNDYTITISNDRYTSSTDLFKASNILHEVTHAFFMSLVDDYTASQNPSVFSEFPTLFQKFVDTKYPGNKDDAHHEEMANSYVEAIGSALQEFQTGIAPAYGAKPDQVYTDLAWGGLREAPIYDKKFPVGSAERLRIDNRYSCESNGGSVGSGTINQQTAIGKPCK